MNADNSRKDSSSHGNSNNDTSSKDKSSRAGELLAGTPRTTEYAAGFACLIGRPNAGKSTLTNALVGHKVAITSSKPQTTRHTIRGIATTEKSQLILVDTPGLHRPRTLLGERLNDLVIATKADLVDRDRLAQHLMAIDQLGDWDAIIPCSATTGEQVDAVRDLLSSYLPTSPQLYPDGVLTDEPEAIMIAELVREAALEGVRDELPHSLAVVVEEMHQREGRSPDNPMLDVHVKVYVERSSQKAIIIGKGGARLREVGTQARRSIEALLGQKVFLDLHVKIAKDWQRDPKQLQRLGF